VHKDQKKKKKTCKKKFLKQTSNTEFRKCKSPRAAASSFRLTSWIW